MPKRNDSSSALSFTVAQQLLERIISNEFQPGTLLPSERELQEMFQVSRTVVREAIKLLAAQGILVSNMGQGTVVASDMIGPVSRALMLAFELSEITVEDLLDLRMMLEPAIAGQAAKNATAVQIRQLKALCRGMEEEWQQDADAWGKSNARFHNLIAQATQNPALAILVEVAVSSLWRARTKHQTRVKPEFLEQATNQHRAIAEAIETRNEERAVEEMRKHLEFTRMTWNFEVAPEGKEKITYSVE